MDPLIYKSGRFSLSVPEPDAAEALTDFYRRNRDYLQPFYPTFLPAFFEPAAWRTKLAVGLEEFQARTSMRTVLFDPENRVIGVANFHSMAFRPLYDCLLGYALDEQAQGKGIISEALGAAIPYVFQRFHMHRISAGYMPRNDRSGSVLKRLGFQVEGYMRDYLLINGKWEDHIITGKINEDWKPEDR